MTELNRRNVVRGAVWTTPVVMIAATAPAFAASQPINCAPTAECKQPGDGQNTKDYTIRTNCTSTTPITCVEVYDDKEKKWIQAEPQRDGTFTAYDFNDSRRDRTVRLTDKYGQVKIYNVAFPPC